MNSLKMPLAPMLILSAAWAAIASTNALADAPTYVAVASQSSISFVGTQQGEKFTGVFKDFDVRIAYAPDQLPTSHIDVTIRLKSLDSKSQDRDSALAGSDWFDFTKHPTATFRAATIRSTPAGPVADADLTIKGVTKRIAFPFTWKVEGGKATLDARVTLDRIDYGVGTGEWADGAIAGKKVDVVVHVVLTAAAAAAPAATPAAKQTPGVGAKH